ncbi:hypothetical protein Tco_1425856 [Tanacetum coccineum]
MLLLKNLLLTLKERIITWKLNSNISCQTNHEIELIESSSRPLLTDTILEIPIPQPTGPVIDITPPEEPESPLVVPKGDKGKDVIQEEATKVGVDPKILASAKGGQEFKKIQDADRLKPKPATDVKIHPNIKPEVLTVYRGNDRRNFDVHNPFMFADFGITKLDELGPIVEKKKNKIVVELMISLGKRYARLNKIPEELGIQSALPTLVQAQSQSSGRKRKHME